MSRGARRFGAIALALLLPALLGVERPRGLGDVRDVRFWSYPDYTRVVVELSTPVGEDLEVQQLSANPAVDRPARLYLDLPKVWVGRRYADGIPVGDGLLSGVRLGQNTLRKTRVVVDLMRYRRHRLLVLTSPHRVVIDVYGDRDDPELLRWPASIGQPDTAFSRLSMPLRSVQRVVIDPGHGGTDPGAIGVGGLREKDVNLNLARRLAQELELRGFEVILTRKDDRTLSLEERTAIAEAKRGDLFVSIHANASPKRTTRGFEIYYLDASHEGHTLRVAARENKVKKSEMDSLQRTMARLRVSEASRHAGNLASMVHQSIAPELSARHRGFQDLGVKRGPFYVLFLSSMPAILVESGFVTNRRDADLLRSGAFLDAMAKQIAMGLERYRDSVPTLLTGAGG